MSRLVLPSSCPRSFPLTKPVQVIVRGTRQRLQHLRAEGKEWVVMPGGVSVNEYPILRESKIPDASDVSRVLQELEPEVLKQYYDLYNELYQKSWEQFIRDSEEERFKSRQHISEEI